MPDLAELRLIQGLASADEETLDNVIARLDRTIDTLEGEISRRPSNDQGIRARVRRWFSNTDPAEQDDLPAAGPAANADQWRLYEMCMHVAEAQLSMSLAQFRQKNYVRGAVNFRRSHVTYEKLWKLLLADSQINQEGELLQEEASLLPHDVARRVVSGSLFLGGVFHFFTSLIPESYQWIVRLLGFHPQRVQGIRELERVVSFAPRLDPSTAAAAEEELGGETNTLSRPPIASALLAWIHCFQTEDFRRAADYLGRLLVAFPRGGLFSYLGGYVARRAGATRLAIRSFRHCRVTADAAVPSLSLVAEADMANCHYLQGEWREAVALYEYFLERHRADSYRACAAHELGLSLHAVGRVQDAQLWMGRVAEFARNGFTHDQYAARKAKEYLRNEGIAWPELISTVSLNFHRAGNPGAALALLELLWRKWRGDGSDRPHWAVSACSSRFGSPLSLKLFSAEGDTPSGASRGDVDESDNDARQNLLATSRWVDPEQLFGAAPDWDGMKTRSQWDVTEYHVGMALLTRGRILLNAVAHELVRFEETALDESMPTLVEGLDVAERDMLGDASPPGALEGPAGMPATALPPVRNRAAGLRASRACFHVIVEQMRPALGDDFLVPHALYFLAKSFAIEAEHGTDSRDAALREADRLASAARGFKDYDFDKPLMRQLTALADRIERLRDV